MIDWFGFRLIFLCLIRTRSFLLLHWLTDVCWVVSVFSDGKLEVTTDVLKAVCVVAKNVIDDKTVEVVVWLVIFKQLLHDLAQYWLKGTLCMNDSGEVQYDGKFCAKYSQISSCWFIQNEFIELTFVEF